MLVRLVSSSEILLYGCIFHWEQALRRKLGKLHTNREQISMAMTKNIIDVFTIISRNEIVRKGIAYFLGIILLNVSAHWLDSSKLGILSTAMKPIFMHKIGLIIAWKGIGNRTMNEKFSGYSSSLLSTICSNDRNTSYQIRIGRVVIPYCILLLLRFLRTWTT